MYIEDLLFRMQQLEAVIIEKGQILDQNQISFQEQKGEITELNKKLIKLNEDQKQINTDLFNVKDDLKSEQKLKSQIENRISLFKNKEDYFKNDIKEKMITIEKLKGKLDDLVNNQNDISITKNLLLKYQTISNSFKEFSYS